MQIQSIENSVQPYKPEWSQYTENLKKKKKVLEKMEKAHSSVSKTTTVKERSNILLVVPARPLSGMIKSFLR